MRMVGALARVSEWAFGLLAPIVSWQENCHPILVYLSVIA